MPSVTSDCYNRLMLELVQLIIVVLTVDIVTKKVYTSTRMVLMNYLYRPSCKQQTAACSQFYRFNTFICLYVNCSITDIGWSVLEMTSCSSFCWVHAGSSQPPPLFPG